IVRIYAMGAEAWERAATEDERRRIAGLLDDAIGAGAFGFSTSFFDTDARGRLVPSRLAEIEEHADLVDVLARRGRGIVQVVTIPATPDGEQNCHDLIQLCGDRVVSTTNVLAYADSNPQQSADLMQRTRDYHAQGLKFWPQMSPRTIDFRINWENSFAFS